MGGHGSSSGYSRSRGEVPTSTDGGGLTDLQKAYQQWKEAQGISTSQLDYLAGYNGNPWPPDASSSHLGWGSGAGIYDQFGGAVTGAEADEMYSAIYNFTGSFYEEMREAQRSGDTTSEYGSKAVTLERFIATGIQTGNGWKGGATYRGIDGISDDAFSHLASLNVGDSVDPNFGGSASWSTKRGVAEGTFSGGKNSVVFVHLGPRQRGVSVKHLSSYGPDENEVLVSKDAKFRVQAVVQAHSAGNDSVYTYIYVEDDE